MCNTDYLFLPPPQKLYQFCQQHTQNRGTLMIYILNYFVENFTVQCNSIMVMSSTKEQRSGIILLVFKTT